jgi:hypothetical protein
VNSITDTTSKEVLHTLRGVWEAYTYPEREV